MATVQKSLRIPEETARTIEEIARASRRDFSSVVNEMLVEAVKMGRCPGIVFVEGMAGRRARVAGTGLDVWEVIASYLSIGHNLERLRDTYH